MLVLGVLILSLVAIVALLPVWPYSASWGYLPASMLMLVPLLFFVLWIVDVV